MSKTLKSGATIAGFFFVYFFNLGYNVVTGKNYK